MVPQPPPADLPPTVRLEDVIITVRAGGDILLNQEVTGIERLGARLAAVYRLRTNQIVFIRGDAGLEFREVARVIDIARGAGLLRVALMTTPAG